MQYPLVGLADRIDWDALDAGVFDYFGTAGRPAVPAHFMLGMLILKATYDLSNEVVFQRWACDPYFQFFTGEAYFQHRVPHEHSGLSQWRKRLAAGILAAMFRESLTGAQDTGALSKRDMQVVTVDTTVQERLVRFPTNAALLYTALVKLGAKACAAGNKLRQSYVRLGKRARIMAGRYADAKQHKHMRKQLKFFGNHLGPVIRDIERNTANDPKISVAFTSTLRKASSIKGQALNRHAKPKVYSWYAPEVQCIGKGKRVRLMSSAARRRSPAPMAEPRVKCPSFVPMLCTVIRLTAIRWVRP